MDRPKLKFTILHLMAFVTAFALVLTLSQRSAIAALIACPFTFGPTIAHAVSSTLSAAVAGFLSASFWTLLTTIVVGPFFLRYSETYPAASDFPVFIFSVVIVSSIFGGYLGARVSLH